MRYPFSVILPSYLGDYENAATNRIEKFKRSVNSFLTQTLKDSELIVVSDGCDITTQIIKEEYHISLNRGDIKLIELPKQSLFSGNVRQIGLKEAKGKFICYLDGDDILGVNHLKMLHDNLDDVHDWFYYHDFTFDGMMFKKRPIKVEKNFIGTSNFCHTSKLDVKWDDGYQHDWYTIKKVLDKPHKEISGEYFVCHIPKILDY